MRDTYIKNSLEDFDYINLMGKISCGVLPMID